MEKKAHRVLSGGYPWIRYRASQAPRPSCRAVGSLPTTWDLSPPHLPESLPGGQVGGSSCFFFALDMPWSMVTAVPILDPKFFASSTQAMVRSRWPVPQLGLVCVWGGPGL
ncbi:hypothetical protein CSPX01_05642 [Colletotrichum filicis]|nr:hypothetical protein CSPX01_05642 [Colletotrichum filicis]